MSFHSCIGQSNLQGTAVTLIPEIFSRTWALEFGLFGFWLLDGKLVAVKFKTCCNQTEPSSLGKLYQVHSICFLDFKQQNCSSSLRELV